MAFDASPAPTEYNTFKRQNLFSGIYKPPVYDVIGVNIYQDFSYSWIGKNGYFAMQTGVNVVLDNVFEFGPFCNYIPGEIVTLPDTHTKTAGGFTNTLKLNTYFYCGNMLAYVPWAQYGFHPKFILDLGLGSASGGSYSTAGVKTNVSYTFFVLKPAVALEMNFFSYLQWTVTGQYRMQFTLNGIQTGSGTGDELGMKAAGFEISTGPVIHF